MKKICLVLVSFLMIISTSVFAVGFHDDSEGKISTIAEALKMKDDSYVTIQGNIEKKLSSDKYLFRDSTGTMTVEIDEDKWEGQDVNSKTKLELQGEIDKGIISTELDVDRVKIIK